MPVVKPVPPPSPRGPRAEPAGPIRADEAYSLKEFLRRVGFSKGALSTAKQEGLPIRRAGGRAFVCGSDWLDFLRRKMH